MVVIIVIRDRNQLIHVFFIFITKRDIKKIYAVLREVHLFFFTYYNLFWARVCILHVRTVRTHLYLVFMYASERTGGRGKFSRPLSSKFLCSTGGSIKPTFPVHELWTRRRHTVTPITLAVFDVAH